MSSQDALELRIQVPERIRVALEAYAQERDLPMTYGRS
jgi:hypothetical protein